MSAFNNNITCQDRWWCHVKLLAGVLAWLIRAACSYGVQNRNKYTLYILQWRHISYHDTDSIQRSFPFDQSELRKLRRLSLSILRQLIKCVRESEEIREISQKISKKWKWEPKQTNVTKTANLREISKRGTKKQTLNLILCVTELSEL